MTEKSYCKLLTNDAENPGADAEMNGENMAAVVDENKGKWRLLYDKLRRPGWKWVIMLGAFLLRATFLGVMYNYTTLSVKLKEFFGTNEEILGWVGSMLFFARSISSPMAAAIAVKIGYRSAIFIGVLLSASSCMLTSFITEIRWYFLTFSLMFGIGASMATFPAYDYLMSYFHKEFVRGSGLMSIASSAGLMVLAPAMESMLDSIGLQHTLRVLAGITLLSAVAVFSFRPSPAEKRRMSVVQNPGLGSSDTPSAPSVDQKALLKPPVHTNKTFTETMSVFGGILRSPDMWILGVLSFTMSLATSFTYINMVSFLKSIGLSVKTSAFTLSMMGVGEFVGTVLSTLLGDRVPLLKMEVLAIVTLAAALVTATITLVTVYPGVLTLVIVMGMCRSTYNLMFFPAVIERMGKYRKLESCAISSVLCGVGYVPGGIIGGALYDATGTYMYSLLICAFLYLATSLLLVWSAYRFRRSKRAQGQMMSPTGNDKGDENNAGDSEAQNKTEEKYVIDMIMTTV